VRIGRSLALSLLAAMALPCLGCGLTPHSFRKLQPSPATARAGGTPAVVPVLVARLEDEDPVVRMAAHDELRRRTGQDLGFVAWASPEERAAAVGRWRSWLAAHPAIAEVARKPEVRPASRRRRTRTTIPAPATTKDAYS
jgi:hypothetical protein